MLGTAAAPTASGRSASPAHAWPGLIRNGGDAAAAAAGRRASRPGALSAMLGRPVSAIIGRVPVRAAFAIPGGRIIPRGGIAEISINLGRTRTLVIGRVAAGKPEDQECGCRR